MKALGIRSSSVLTFIVSVAAVGQLLAAADTSSQAKDGNPVPASAAAAPVGEAGKSALPAPAGSDANQTPGADTVTPSAQLPRLVVVVLPFENATDDPAGDDWRLALPPLIRMGLDHAEFTSTRSGEEVRSALLRSGWTVTNTIEPALARKVAREVKANVVVWGRITRPTNGWALNVKILRVAGEAPPAEIQVTAPRWMELVESVTHRLAEQLQRRIADDDRRVLRMVVMTDSEKAAGYLARAIVLEIEKSPAADVEQAWRAVLAADPRCGLAHGSLFNLLREAGRTADLERSVQEFLRQQPDLCLAHMARAATHDDMAGAEAELRAALRLHRGCPDATAALFQLLGSQERWAELADVLKGVVTARPDHEAARIFLVAALAKSGERAEAHQVLDLIKDLPEEDDEVDIALLIAASAVSNVELAALELQRLGPKAGTNAMIRSALDSFKISSGRRPGDLTHAPITRPRTFTPEELDAELERRLTPAERKLAVNPLEITPELAAEARRLTVGLTNRGIQAFALFAEVARRGRGTGDLGQRTASDALKVSADPETRLSCQEHAKLFVAMARSLGLEAWLTHIDRCADGSAGYHDCAALFLDGEGWLVDPTWRVFDVRHEEFTVLDDVQVISHQAMQSGDQWDPQRLRLGLKLNPDDRWTRLQFVTGMARAGELEAAVEELRKVRATGAETWNVHTAAAEIEIAQDHWQPALTELLRAVALNPGNAGVHLQLAQVYQELNDQAKADEHIAKALELDRGEVPNELRRKGQLHLQMVSRIAATQSSAPGSREAVERQAEAGDFAAQMAMAKACFEATPPRNDEGLRWGLKAATQGEVQAQLLYARALLDLGGEAVAPEAIKWFTRSAEQGYADAQYQLGLLLYEGKRVIRDRVAGAQWVCLAANQKHREARHLLDELELFLSAAEMAEAQKRADAFKPAERATAPPRSGIERLKTVTIKPRLRNP